MGKSLLLSGATERQEAELPRSCRHAVFRQLVRSGEIDQHLETNANECRQHAERLIDQGTFYEQAWSWAARVHLLAGDMWEGAGRMTDAPQRISPDTDTAVELQHQGPAGQDLHLSRDPRTCASALASRESSTFLGPSSTTWWQDTSWPRPTIWCGWPTCRHHGRPRPFSRCDCPGRSARKWLDRASDPPQTTPE